MNEQRRLNAAGIHCAQLPSCPSSDEPNPPSEAPAWPWAELGPWKPVSAQCTMPSNHNRGHWLNLLCAALKKPKPPSYCQGDRTNCIQSLHGTWGCLEGRQGWGGGGWCAACSGRPCREQPWCPWAWLSQAWQTSHSAGLCCAIDQQREPTVPLLSWWAFVLHIIPATAWGKELRVTLCWRKPQYQYLHLYFPLFFPSPLPLPLISAKCLCSPRSSQQSRRLGGNDPISRATRTGLIPGRSQLTVLLLFLHGFLSICFLNSACPLPGEKPKKQGCGTSRVLPSAFTTAGGFLAFQFQERLSKFVLP